MLDDLPADQVRPFEAELYRFMDAAHGTLLQNIREKKTLDDETKNQLTTVLKEFKDRFVAQRKAGAAKV